MSASNFFEKVEEELVKAKRDQAALERERVAASNAHSKADAAAQQMNRYVDALEDSLAMLNSAVGRNPAGSGSDS